MRKQIEALLQAALAECQRQELMPTLPLTIQVEHTRERSHGDFATNAAMLLAKGLKRPPREIATLLQQHIPDNTVLARVEVAGPGFLNFYLTPTAFYQHLIANQLQGDNYARSEQGQGQRVLLEFVSANPTGPLHVGHGRGAAYGASVANLLEMAGYEVLREYYVNDAGRQMDILAVSVWWRYLEAHQLQLPFPKNAYHGQYVVAIAEQLQQQYADRWVRSVAEATQGLPLDEGDGGDKDVYIDAVINLAKACLGEEAYQQIHQLALSSTLADIKDDLAEFGITMQSWFHESTLVREDLVQQAMDQLKASGYVYERDGALWFKSESLGDEKDRVLVRANGQSTYFAADVAYHMHKFARGYDLLIDVLGADHHGYIARIKAVIQAMGGNPDSFSVQLVQFAILYRGTERIPMSTRSGSFVALRELRDEVGCDAARFFYVMRKVEQHMDFDLELAKSQSQDNPVYYVQYAHARICSILRQLAEKGYEYDQSEGFAALSQLTLDQELTLVTDLARYPLIIELAAMKREPHQVAHYVREIANNFHSYYNAQQILGEDSALRNARITLIKAVQRVIQQSLSLLGVSAPQSM
jgi:arginyl-tRNA synthetase